MRKDTRSCATSRVQYFAGDNDCQVLGEWGEKGERANFLRHLPLSHKSPAFDLVSYRSPVTCVSAGLTRRDDSNQLPRNNSEIVRGRTKLCSLFFTLGPLLLLSSFLSLLKPPISSQQPVSQAFTTSPTVGNTQLEHLKPPDGCFFDVHILALSVHDTVIGSHSCLKVRQPVLAGNSSRGVSIAFYFVCFHSLESRKCLTIGTFPLSVPLRSGCGNPRSGDIAYSD